MTPCFLALFLITTPPNAVPREDETVSMVSAVSWRVGLGTGLVLIASSGFAGEQLAGAAQEAAPGFVGESAAPFIVAVAAAGFAVAAGSALVGVRIEGE